MAKFLLGICLMLVVASSVIYEAQGHFMLKDYLEKKFPSKCNEFAPFANKGMLELATDLQGSCPPTAEFKNFFTQFKLYVTFLESASATSQNIDAEMTTKCDELFKSMAPLCSGKGVKSTDAGAVKVTMLAMGKTLIAEKKNTKPITPEHKKQLATDMSKWTNTFGSFVKTASERKGRPLDIATYGLDGNANAGGAASGGKTESGSSASTKTESKSASAKGGSGFKDTTGPTLGSPSGSPKASPSGSSPKASPSGSSSAGGSETSTKGSASAGGKASGKTMESKESQSKTSSESSSKNSSSSTSASPKQVQEETSKEVMAFIMELEKKNSAKSELKIFFEKLKATMKTACATTAAQNPKEYASATRSASDKLSEAMTLVGSRNQESKMKSNMDTSKNELLNSVKQIQDMTSKMSSEKSVTSTQKTEMKQTVTKMEQATTKFVETATSSSSSSSSFSSSSSSSSASSQQQQGSAGMVKKE